MAEKEEENVRSVWIVALFFDSLHRGGLYKFQIQQGGQVVHMDRREKGGADEPLLLHPVAKFFVEKDPSLPVPATKLECARLHGSSKLYLLLDRGSYPPHSLDGITYDFKTMSQGSFRQPTEYKPNGRLISAYGKLYYLTDPTCFPQIPTPSFERYDPTTDSWECLPPFPFYDMDWKCMEIVGYAVLEGCILLSLGFDYRYKFAVFHVVRRKWYVVKAFNSYDDYVSYSIMGRAVVIDDTVYAVSDLFGEVITLSFQMKFENDGHSFSVRQTVLPGLEILPPRSPFCMMRSISMAYLGNMEFCIVQTGFNYESVDRQHLCITTFQIVDEEGNGMRIKTLHSTVHELYLPSYGAYIMFSFTPDGEDIESEQEWTWEKALDSYEEDEKMVSGIEKVETSLDSDEEEEKMFTGIEEVEKSRDKAGIAGRLSLFGFPLHLNEMKKTTTKNLKKKLSVIQKNMKIITDKVIVIFPSSKQ